MSTDRSGVGRVGRREDRFQRVLRRRRVTGEEHGGEGETTADRVEVWSQFVGECVGNTCGARRASLFFSLVPLGTEQTERPSKNSRRDLDGARPSGREKARQLAGRRISTGPRPAVCRGGAAAGISRRTSVTCAPKLKSASLLLRGPIKNKMEN